MRLKRLLILITAALTALLPIAALAAPPETVSTAHVYAIYGDVYAMRGITWDMTIDEVAAAEGGRISKETVTIKSGVELYGNAVTSLEYAFNDGRMISRKFTMKNKNDYSTTFYGLFYFYGVPVFRDRSNYTWELPDMQIKLTYGSRLQVTFTVRESEEIGA